MKKLIIAILLLLSYSLFADDKAYKAFTILGADGDVLANIQKRLVELQHTKPLYQYNQQELREPILKAIQPFGYLKAEVQLDYRGQQNPIIKVNLGPQLRINQLHVQLIGEGSHTPQLVKTTNGIPLKVGAPLNMELYNQTKQNIINTAENLGYLHGAFKIAEIIIDKEKYTSHIHLVFDTGPLYYFGQVQFNPTYINPDLLHRFVPFKPGQSYSTEQILKLNNDLAGSGYFSSVLVKPEIGSTPTVPVTVNLKPAKKFSYSLGAGYGTDTGVRGRAALNVIPVNQRGHKFNVIAQGSFTQNALQAQYLIPGKNPVNDQYSVTGNFSNLNYNTGYSNALLISLAQQHHSDYFKRSISLNGLYESFNYSLQPKEYQLTLYPKLTLGFSKTQNQLFSPSGFNITFNTLGASKAALSEFNFAQLSLDAKAAITFEPVGLRLYGHTIQGITAIDNINQFPLSLALLLGGTDNLKAVSFNSIGPGKKITYGGIEIQKETVKDWYVIGFYDVGDVYDPTVRHLNYDTGAALMWVSPIGPIKVGLAQSIDSHFGRVGTNPRLVINMGPDL
jgi:translocation and assembly module TamA